MAGRRMLASIAVVFILLIATSAASSHAYPPLRRMTRQTVPDDGSSNTPADNPGTSPVNSPIDRTGAPSQNGNLPPGPSGGGAANSIIGLSLEEPTCLTRDADTPLQTDCIIAMNAMEMEWGSRITAYIGTSASLRILQGLPAMPQIDFLGLPRVYWAGSCVISVGSNTERQEATGNPVKGDWAHKNALMVSTAFVIDKCVRTHKGGGWVTAGRSSIRK
ncbi:MAG: hypothetical protein M1812_004343 [Candelaria pacifica]|nr:MAG: hypothetical protein M1812_004343 [Candelaria pacifica]